MIYNNKLQKNLKKYNTTEEPKNLLESLVSHIELSNNLKNSRELYFLSCYYGIGTESLTLEAIEQINEKQLTRERVRQIIDNTVKKIKTKSENPYRHTQNAFEQLLKDNDVFFIRMSSLLNDPYFTSFNKNQKGFISFLNDCGIRQIAYRKQYYLYSKNINRREIVLEIQKENKDIRKTKTLAKMMNKSKTVTYVPYLIRHHLVDYAEKHDINLNVLYEQILKQFIAHTPYTKIAGYVFPKTQSWKARKGKAQWEQIGIYIDKIVFDNVRKTVDEIKNELNINVSLMGFICQAFIWHKENFGVTTTK